VVQHLVEYPTEGGKKMKRILLAAAITVGLWATSAGAFDIDHYLCWQYKNAGKMGLSQVYDQFVAGAPVDGKKLKWLCNPASKDARSPINPNDHLCCYGIKPIHFAAPAVTQSDQFRNDLLESKNKAKLFCVPCTKS
jgi:hypothetical protein